MSTTVDNPRGKTPPDLFMDPYAAENIANPYPFFDALHNLAPVVYMVPHGAYAVGGYAEVKTILHDTETFTSTAGIGLSDITKPGAWGRKPSVFTEVQGEEHARNRSVLLRIISPVVVRKWRADFQQRARQVVDKILDMGEFDGVRDLTEEFILQAFPQAIGFTITREQAIVTGDLNFNELGPNNERLVASRKEAEHHMDWYRRQMTREALTPGGIGAKIFDAADQGLIPADVAPEMLRAFLRAGMDSTISGIGTSFHMLGKHPDQWDMVREDPNKARFAFEEAIRLETPTVSYRTTTRDVELAGYHMAADTKVGVYFGAANRDPARWDNPTRYDITRDLTGHMAFGDGVHVCLGQVVARLEAECLITAVAERARKIEVVGEPVYREVSSLRTLDRLPMKIYPA